MRTFLSQKIEFIIAKLVTVIFLVPTFYLCFYFCSLRFKLKVSGDEMLKFKKSNYCDKKLITWRINKSRLKFLGRYLSGMHDKMSDKNMRWWMQVMDGTGKRLYNIKGKQNHGRKEENKTCIVGAHLHLLICSPDCVTSHVPSTRELIKKWIPLSQCFS